MLALVVVAIIVIVIWKKWDSIEGFFSRVFGRDDD